MNIQHLYIGCDISKSTIDFVDGTTGVHSRVSNSAADIARFLTPYHDQPARFVHEATGAYGHQLRVQLADAGLDGVQVNPLHARRFAQSRGRLAKTDKIDAVQLADMARRYDLAPTRPWCHHTEQLKSLIMRRDQLVEQRADEDKRLQQSDMTVVQQSHERLMSVLSQEIEAFDRHIAQLIADHDNLKQNHDLIQTIPGVGRATAPVILALLPEAGYLHAKSVASLAGLAPFNKDSGMKSANRVIAGGRRRLRRALYMAALGASRSHSAIGDKYRALRQAGKPPKVALIAIARKIATIINAVLKTKRAYQ